ncbi:Clp protease N-terminal domain-containing protein [Nocardia niwae]|uniref:Clp protease N-terminal domain-containing protein n=1 Tax=Nocardia niwae TaxID=626084 RepID=A0ABV2XDG3_9NOCA|nr:Clp protease N-terminal domain-containing protein [Nocardia niwae]
MPEFEGDERTGRSIEQPPGAVFPDDGLTRTPRLHRILLDSADVAREIGHDFVGVEHLVLAILREGRSVPVHVLARMMNPVDYAEALTDFLRSDGYNTPGTATGGRSGSDGG